MSNCVTVDINKIKAELLNVLVKRYDSTEFDKCTSWFDGYINALVDITDILEDENGE